jgi:hypothetical protein
MAYRGGDGTVIDRARQDDWNAPDAIPSLVPEHWPSDSSHHPSFTQPTRCPEIDCVRHLLPAHLVSSAEARAIATGVGADNVLVTWGLLSEETYVAALSTHLGLEFEPLFSTPRRQCPLSDDELIQAATTGMLHLQDGDGSRFVVAPRLVDSRRLVAAANSGNELARSIRLTSTARLRDFVARHSAIAIEQRAAEALRDEHPEVSAGVRHFPPLRLLGFIALALVVAVVRPAAAMAIAEIVLGAVFLAWTILRLLGLLTKRLRRRRPLASSDEWLPIYSVVVALYREAAAVPGLVAALRSLDYPGIMAQTPQAFRLASP